MLNLTKIEFFHILVHHYMILTFQRNSIFENFHRCSYQGLKPHTILMLGGMNGLLWTRVQWWQVSSCFSLLELVRHYCWFEYYFFSCKYTKVLKMSLTSFAECEPLVTFPVGPSDNCLLLLLLPRQRLNDGDTCLMKLFWV